MDLVGICNDYAAATKQALKATEERVHADGKKLSAQRAALTNTAARLDGRRRRAINTEEEIDGRGIHGGELETHGSKVGKRAATTAKNSQRCNELNALRMSRVASTQPGWDWRRAVTVWVRNGKPAEVRPTWIGHGEPSGWRGGREESAEVGGWR